MNKELEEFLDTIDIYRYLTYGKDLWAVLWEIELDYKEHGHLFKNFTMDDFYTYLEQRYKDKIYFHKEEIVRYYVGAEVINGADY